MARASSSLRRSLAIEPGEGRLVVWAAAALFLMAWAAVSVSNASDTLFLKRVGVAYLPLVFLVNSVLLTGTTFAAGRVAARADSRRLLLSTFVVLGAVLVVLWILVLAAAPGIATTLVIAAKQIDVIAQLMFWTVVGGLLTSRQGKRLVALMTAGGTLGTIFGSFTSAPIGRAFGIPFLLAVAATAFAAAAVVSLPLTGSVPARLYRTKHREAPEQPQRLATFWRESSLFRVLAATSFLAGVLGPMLYYEFSSAADLATRTADGEQRLLALYGMLRGWINIGVLLLQVGASGALFRRIGVPLAAAFAPAAYVLGFAGLGVRFALPTAMPATMGTSVIDHTIYEPAQSILAALLPRRMRAAATSVIQGPAKRAGAAVGSLLILAIVAITDPTRVALVALPIAATWMALALMLWRDYPNLLLEAASVRRPGSDDADSALAFVDAATLRTLQSDLEGNDFGACRAACALFAEAPAALAIDALVRALGACRAPNRPLIWTALDRTSAHPSAWQAPALAASVVRTLETAAGLSDLETAKLVQMLGRADASAASTPVLSLLEKTCSHRSAAIRTASIVAIGRLRRDEASSLPDEALEEALAGSDSAARSIAIAELRFALVAGDPAAATWASRFALLEDQLGRVATTAPGDDATPGVNLRAEVIDALADIALRRDDVGLFPAAAGASATPGASGGAAARGAASVSAADDAAGADAAHVESSYAERIAACARAVLAMADDADASVRIAVLRFVGNAELAEHCRLLAERLSSRDAAEASAAHRALERLGPRAADALLHALRHGGRRAREVVPDLLREIRADSGALRARVDSEIDHARRLLLVLGALEASSVSGLALQRIRERVDESVYAVLELEAAILGEDRIARVCRGLARAWNVRDRAVLLEALESLLPPADRERILPLLEDASLQRLAATAARALGRRLPTAEDALAEILASRDPLTNALVAATVDARLLAKAAPDFDVNAALRAFHAELPQRRDGATAVPGPGGEPRVGTNEDSRERSRGGEARTDTNDDSAALVVGGKVRDAEPRAETPAGSEESAMLNPVEKMLHLRTLDLFEGLTTRQLSELARVVREVSATRGEVIVREGDFDDSMYFIVDGSVSITKGGQAVAELGARDFFGEMSVFDGEKRSATATAASESRLLRLARGDLFEVMEDQPAIGIGICQTLVRRVRSMLEERAANAASPVPRR